MSVYPSQERKIKSPLKCRERRFRFRWKTLPVHTFSNRQVNVLWEYLLTKLCACGWLLPSAFLLPPQKSERMRVLAVRQCADGAQPIATLGSMRGRKTLVTLRDERHPWPDQGAGNAAVPRQLPASSSGAGVSSTAFASRSAIAASTAS